MSPGQCSPTFFDPDAPPELARNSCSHAQFPHRHRHRLRRRGRDHHGAGGAGRARSRADHRRRQCRPRAGDSNALLTAEICGSDVPVFMGADRPLDPRPRARALVPWQGRPRRSRLPCPEARARARARSRCDPAPGARGAGLDSGDARPADQYRTRAGARAGACGADRPLRGDGRRAVLRGQCDAGGGIQHLGRSGGGARRLPLEAAASR